MTTDEDKKNLIGWITSAICLILAVATVYIVYRLHPDATGLERLTLVVAYIIVILVFFFGFMVLIAMATHKIDLSGLLCDPVDKKASMSRFQLLIFTFVIAFTLVLIILSSGPGQLKFPDVPSGILLLLGISASTHLVNKGIQAGKDGDGGDGDGNAAAEAKKQAAITQAAAAQAAAAQVAAAQAAAATAQGAASQAKDHAAAAQDAVKKIPPANQGG